MPYKTISDLPKAQVDQYNEHQKDAFLKAFNNAYEEYHHDESRAFAVAQDRRNWNRNRRRIGGCARPKAAGLTYFSAHHGRPSLPVPREWRRRDA